MGALTLNSLFYRFPGKIRIVFRNYPLDPTCNRMLQYPVHAHACEAAQAAFCANEQGKFEQAYEALFENQASFDSERPTAWVKKTVPDGKKLDACLNSPQPGLAILRDVEEANQLGVKSTPTFYINGHKLEGALPAPVWIKVIDALLAKP